MNRLTHIITIPFSAADDEAPQDANSIMNDVLNSLGGVQPDASAQSETPPAPQDSVPDAGAAPAGEQAGGQEGAAQHTPDEKQQYAWAEMNRANKQLTALLGKIADANGIEYSNAKDLVDKLSDDAIVKMSQKQNVPVELLRKIEALQADSDAYKKQQLQNNAAIGFQALQQEYGLDQQALEQFALELNQAGKNPFEVQVDILTEYKTRHFNEILQASIAKAVEAALKNDASVSQQSSQPVKGQGSAPSGSPDTPTKINDQRGLQSLLNGIM